MIRQGRPQFIQTLTQAKQESSQTVAQLFDILNEKFRPLHKETTLSLQNYELNRHADETTKEWMYRLRMKATECKYKENDRRLKELFFNDISDDDMKEEIKRVNIS